MLLASSPYFITPAAAEAPDLLLEPAVSVLDLLGRGIPGVEILVFPLGGSDGPAAILHTDPRGKFSLQSLPAGSYILALSKPGYRIHLARANSALLSLLSIRLIPERESAPTATPSGRMDWVLRLPTEDVLKQEGHGPVPGSSPGIPVRSGEGEPHRLVMRADVNQWYTSTLAALGAGAGDPESSGRTTELQVGGELQSKGSWEVQGSARSLTTDARLATESGSETDQGSNRVKLAMNYRLTPADSVEFQAHYDRDRYRSASLQPEIVAPSQELRTLGYAANYTRKVDDAQRWRVGTDLLRAQARLPQPAEDPASAPEAGDLTDWRWSTAADYQATLPGDHRISFTARTRIYRYEMRDEGWAVAPIQAGVSRMETGDRGWSVSFSGEDAWRLTGPVQILLGLETHLAEAWGKSVLLVPRLGARRETADSVVQGWILVRNDSGNAQASPESDLSSPALGYHAEVSQRFEGEWIVSGHVQRNAPLSGELPLSASDPVPQAVPMLLMVDPRSWSQEVGFAVSKDLCGVRGTLESDGGKIVGRVGSLLTEAPVQSLVEGSARYLAVRASASVLKTDTLLHFDYTRLDGTEIPGPEVSSQINVTVFQPIPVVSGRGAGSWRVLFAYQGLTRESEPDPVQASGGFPERIHRLSGGVGVTF